jgi:acyl-coenzyme A synthetase/AMP-(fatty) acid ligase
MKGVMLTHRNPGGEHRAGKKLRRIEFVEEIPMSASGKILRRVLRDHYGAAVKSG